MDRPKHFALYFLITCLLAWEPFARAKTFELETAGIADIQAAVDAGALTYEKLVSLYLARIEAYDQQGPKLNTVITLNPKALETAKALDLEFKTKGRRSPLHGIPVLVKDNYDTADLPTTGGSFTLDGSIPYADAPMVKQLRDAGAIILAKVNLDEFAHGAAGFSSLGGQTRNAHNPLYTPAGSSAGTGAGLAAWFAPLGLGTDTGGSIRFPSSVEGIVGLKPTNGLTSRTGIVPCDLPLDTGGPMGRTVYDVALALGFLTGVDPKDPLTRESIGLFFKDYTPFLKKDALKGVRIGVIRDLAGSDAEVDAIINTAVVDLKNLGAEIVDPVHFPAMALYAQMNVIEPIMYTGVRLETADYLAALRPGFPKTIKEIYEKGLALKEPAGRYHPYPSYFNRLKAYYDGPPPTSLTYTAALGHGMTYVRETVVGMFADNHLDVVVYPTRPKRPNLIDPDGPTKPAPKRTVAPSYTAIANVSRLPELVVPAGLTTDKLPVTISFLGLPYSEPKILAYGYAYEQATHHRASPSTTPALAGEKFDY